VAIQYGAEVPFLREEYADDYSPISIVTVYTLRRLLPETFDVVVQLMPNCPLRGAEEIKEALKNFEAGGDDFQISCFKFGWMNPWWAYQLESNTPTPIFEDAIRNQRSQDQPDLYCPTGAIWVAKANALLKSETFYGTNFNFFPMSWQSALDIDNYEDLEMAKAVFKLKDQCSL
jgi:N-acylneuraminate cytidylyltransferase